MGRSTARWFPPHVRHGGLVRAKSHLLAIRVLQGLALGGEYGGAAVYVAELRPRRQARLLHKLHSKSQQHWACLFSLIVILVTSLMSKEASRMGLASTGSCFQLSGEYLAVYPAEE